MTCSNVRSVLVAVTLLWCASSCRRNEGPQTSTGAPRVTVDAKTFAVFTTTQPPQPLAHPGTGQLTLMPAMYCPQCQRWYPLPPLEVVQRSPSARNCPVHKSPLLEEGPIPENATPLDR